MDRRAGGWPTQTKQLDQEGRLLQEALEQVKIEEEAVEYMEQHPELYLTLSETLELHDIPLHPRA